MHQDSTWYGGRPQPRQFVLDGDPATPPQKGVEPPFLGSRHVYCDQTAAWIKMPLGTEVGLGLRDIVLDGDPALPPLKGHSPQFSANVHCVQMAGWMKTPLGAEVDLGPGHIVLDGSQLPAKGAQQPPRFGPSIVTTIAHLSYC